MHPRDVERLAQTGVDNSVRLLCRALGQTTLVLLTEHGEINLWLIASLVEENVFYYITDHVTESKQKRKFSFHSFIPAREMYEQVVSAGSWYDYDDNLNKS